MIRGPLVARSSTSSFRRAWRESVGGGLSCGGRRRFDVDRLAWQARVWAVMDEAFVKSVRLLPPEQGERRAGYPRSLAAISALADGVPLHPSVAYLDGENGSGKSTLLEAVAVAAGMSPRAARRASHSQLGTRTPSCGGRSAWCVACAVHGRITSSAPRAY
jgi:hypothetical protein